MKKPVLARIASWQGEHPNIIPSYIDILKEQLRDDGSNSWMMGIFTHPDLKENCVFFCKAFVAPIFVHPEQW